MFIPVLIFHPSRIPNPEVKKPPDPGSASLYYSSSQGKVYYLLGEGERAEPEARPGVGWQPAPPRGAHSPGGGSDPQDGVPPQHPLHLPPRHSGQLTAPCTHIVFNRNSVLRIWSRRTEIKLPPAGAGDKITKYGSGSFLLPQT
jgi:hypothetical protein